MTPKELFMFYECIAEASEWVASNNDDLSFEERELLVHDTANKLYEKKTEKENDSIHRK